MVNGDILVGKRTKEGGVEPLVTIAHSNPARRSASTAVSSAVCPKLYKGECPLHICRRKRGRGEWIHL